MTQTKEEILFSNAAGWLEKLPPEATQDFIDAMEELEAEVRKEYAAQPLVEWKEKFNESEVKHLLFYGTPSRQSDFKIDDGVWKLDFAIDAMFDLLDKHTFIDRKAAEELFWKRIKNLANGAKWMQVQLQQSPATEPKNNGGIK
jgi:hypothetical protein